MNKMDSETTSDSDHMSSIEEADADARKPSGRRRVVFWGGGLVVLIGLLVGTVVLFRPAEKDESKAIDRDPAKSVAVSPIDLRTLKVRSIEPKSRVAIADLAGQIGPQLNEIGTTLDSASFVTSSVTEQKPASNPDEVPREQRWQIVFAAGLTEGQYARQIDALGLEIGTLGDDGEIEYVADIGTAKPKRHKGSSASQRQLYFTWDRGDLNQADRILLANIGMKVAGRMVLHCCSDEVVKKFATLEHEFQGKPVVDILRTRFSVKQTFRGYEVYVLDQQLREKGAKKSE